MLLFFHQKVTTQENKITNKQTNKHKKPWQNMELNRSLMRYLLVTEPTELIDCSQAI